ncbi:DUF4097 family beta strand repeat-containing protein [Alicyclobacillus sp. SO9]|uniref:DUF4097 family beta strand repeat-containing protein n=1 Tax=Alicyclobacillus sp. SO9 TaxID=2665646 RepID=UPI0018E6FD23|nr:DUF4097 family beta strand repeat-containing protein [Alicyclobacillus sp. SO9]QQE80205.1 DUF4097 family beta strand repeat protein [Alicyclobacillus sp. SO9]
MLKQIAIAGAALIAIGGLGLGVMAATGHTSGFSFSINDSSGLSIIGHNLSGHSVQKQQTVDAGNAKSVTVDASIAAIRLYPANTQKATVTLSGSTTIPDSELQLTSKLTGQTLQIRLKEPNTSGIGQNINLKLDVSVPQHLYDNLDVHANVGSISIEKVNSKQMTVHVSTGKIDVKNLHSAVTATSNVGKVAVTNVTGPLHLTANTGAVNVQEKTLTDNIDASTNTGAVSISSDKDPKNLSFDLSTSLGAVNVGLPGVNYAEQSKRHLQGTIGQGGPTIHASSDLGSVSLE